PRLHGQSSSRTVSSKTKWRAPDPRQECRSTAVDARNRTRALMWSEPAPFRHRGYLGSIGLPEATRVCSGLHHDGFLPLRNRELRPAEPAASTLEGRTSSVAYH